MLTLKNTIPDIMRFALVDNKKVEAKSGLTGICPGCSQTLIPKCGDQRVHHWAHSRNKMCDTWWEPETEWHRKWKNKFPEELQEYFLTDKETGEKHIADIHTDKEFVIEFQHSHITPQERNSRERFYKNMAWVVDGTRLKRDYPRFLKGKNTFKIVRKGIFRVDSPEEYFPSSWLDSSVPVIFDFQDTNSSSEDSNTLYCLFPVKIGRSAIIAEITPFAFVNKVLSYEWVTRTRQFINDIIQVDKEQKDQLMKLQNLQANMMFQKFLGHNTYPKKRRF